MISVRGRVVELEDGNRCHRYAMAEIPIRLGGKGRDPVARMISLAISFLATPTFVSANSMVCSSAKLPCRKTRSTRLRRVVAVREVHLLAHDPFLRFFSTGASGKENQRGLAIIERHLVGY